MTNKLTSCDMALILALSQHGPQNIMRLCTNTDMSYVWAHKRVHHHKEIFELQQVAPYREVICSLRRPQQ